MLELSQDRENWRLGYGGDTLNTAIHLARLGMEVGYLTAIGSDPLSAGLVADWRAEGLDTSLLLTHPQRTTGLYAVSTDPHGERSFAYWRDTSAVRELFTLDGVDRAMSNCDSVDLFGFSLISLAILPDEGRKTLLDLASLVRANGGHVMFDGNYRARLWSCASEASHWRDRAIAIATIGLPTLEDEVALGLPDDPQAVAAHWQQLGCAETVVKLGADGCLLPNGTTVPPPKVLQPIDTSGAGDAFNAGYLAARLAGVNMHEAALRGHELAGWCVMRSGAIPPRDATAPYSPAD